MKRFLLFAIALGLTATAARAELLGTWDTSTVGASTVYTLTVTPTDGEVMYGFDIGVFSDESGFEYYTDGMSGDRMVFSASSNVYPYSYFRLDKSGLNTITGSTDVGSTSLTGAFAATGDGVYADGWDSALELLQISVPSGSGLDPTDFTYTDADGMYAYPVASVGVTQVKTQIRIGEVPEPSAFALLGCGLLGLLAYAWRKRR